MKGLRPYAHYANSVSILPSGFAAKSKPMHKYSDPSEQGFQTPEEAWLKGAPHLDTGQIRTWVRELTELFHARIQRSLKDVGEPVLMDHRKRGALGKHFRENLEAGTVTVEDLRSAVIYFASHYRSYHRPGKDPQITYLANRHSVLQASLRDKSHSNKTTIKRRPTRVSTIDEIRGVSGG